MELSEERDRDVARKAKVETSVNKCNMLGDIPKTRVSHSNHGESLKSASYEPPFPPHPT
jgi:hypothetical protein